MLCFLDDFDMESSENWKKKTKLTFPKMELSKSRMKLLLLLFGIPFCLVLWVMLNEPIFLIVPLRMLGIIFYIILIAVPYIVIRIFNPTFFMPYDWRDIKVVNDLLIVMMIDNQSRFEQDDFQWVREELTETAFNGR